MLKSDRGHERNEDDAVDCLPTVCYVPQPTTAASQPAKAHGMGLIVIYTSLFSDSERLNIGKTSFQRRRSRLQPPVRL